MGEFDSLIETMPDVTAREESIDVSSFFEKEEGTVVFTFRDPDVPSVFTAQLYAAEVRKRFPDFQLALAQTVATMGVSHVAPASDAPTLTYCALVKKNPALFWHVLGKFQQAFPHLSNLDSEIEAKKNE